MFERIRQMLIKEFIQVLRDPKMKPILFVMPVVQLLIFGYAATTDVRNIQTVIYDQDRTVLSRDLATRFESSGYFTIVGRIDNDAAMQELMDHGDAQAIIKIGPNFEQELRAGRTSPVQIIVDGTDSNTASIVLNYSGHIAAQFDADMLSLQRQQFGAAFRPPGQVQLSSRAWFNENLESRPFFVPGVMAILVMIATLMLTSMAVVREKEIGTMEQILVTPMRPGEFILGKTVPFAIIGFVDVILITVVGVFWFDIPIRGSLPLLLACTALYLMSTIGAGLLISTISQTQQQALMTTFFFNLPAILLSGFMFPIANMPVVVQWLTYLNPLRYFIVIIRGIFLKGVGIEILWPQMVGLLVLGIVSLWISTRRFHKTLA